MQPAGLWKLGMTCASFTGPVGAGALDRGDVDAVGLQRRGRDLGAGLVQQQQGAVVGRLLDDHPVAGADEVAEEERGALHRAVGDHHLAGIDPVELRDPLAQPGVALAGPVGERGLPVGLERARRGVPNRLGGKHVGAGGAAGEADRVGAIEGQYRNGSSGTRLDRGAILSSQCRLRSSWSRSRCRPTAAGTARSRLRSSDP